MGTKSLEMITSGFDFKKHVNVFYYSFQSVLMLRGPKRARKSQVTDINI